MRCRGQKLRCDGQQPCGRCIAQGAECKFDGGQRGVGLGNAVELNTPHQRQNVGGPMGIPGSSASGFREGVVGSMPSSPSGGALALAMDHGYFPGSSSSSPVLSRTPPQPMYPPPAAALSSFTPGAVSQPQFVAHGRAATTIPALTQTQGHPRSTHFSGPYGPAPSIPAESPSSTTSHPRFQPGTSSSGPNSWHDRHGGRMAPPPSTQAFSSYPPTNTISQSQSWPNVGTVGSSMASSRSIPPPGNMTHPATTPFEHEILARLTRVENALHELGQDVQGILSSMSSHPRHPRQNPSYSVSPPSTAVHGAERLAAAERIGHGTSPQIQASTHLSPRLRHEGAHVDLRNISRTPQGAPPPHIHPSGPSALRGPSPVPSTLRGGHVRPRTSGSGTDERVQIPPRTSSTMFGSRGSPGFAPGQQSSETRVGQGQYSDEYPRSALPVGLESVPERPSSWSGPREERGLERERGSERDPGQMREIAEQGALTKPRTPPELPTVSAIDAWRSGSRGRQRATTDVGSTASPSNSLHQAQLFPAPIRAVHHQSQQQPGQQQRQPQHQLHQQQYPHQHQHQHQHHIEEHPQPQHEEQSHQLQHARPSDDRPMHGDDGDRGVKRRRLSEESD
ncbi:unnamed protein product [Tilletia controversa]|nr:unnamed protein product [Tilletia controversa]